MGLDEPRRRRAAEPARRHRRTDDAHASRTPSRCSRSSPARIPDDPGDRGRRTARPIPDLRARRSQRDGLKGARIGVLRQAYERDTTDPEIVDVFMAALEDLKRAGAAIVDPARVELDAVRRAAGRRRRAAASSTTSTAIWPRRAIACRCTRSTRSSGRGGSIRRSQRAAANRRRSGAENGPDTPACKAEADYREQFRARRRQDDGRA